MTDALSTTELARRDAYWRAANYLTVGQISLVDNPLLREPLKPEQMRIQGVTEGGADADSVRGLRRRRRRTQ
jgi:phosphoketolase